MIYYSLCQRYNNPCFYGFPFDEVQFSSCNEIDISPHSSINQQYIPSFPTISHILYIVESSMCFVLSDITIGRHGHLPLTVTARILRSNFTYKLQPYARTMSNCWFDCAHSCRQAQHFQLINPACCGSKTKGKTTWGKQPFIAKWPTISDTGTMISSLAAGGGFPLRNVVLNL